jgi:hypothetical protein
LGGSTSLLEIGFIASLVDSSLYILHSSATHIFLLIYVDDIIITRSNPSIIHFLTTKLQHEFPLKNLGHLNFFNGIQASQTANGLLLCQAKFIYNLLHQIHMQDSKPAKSPSPSGMKLSKLDGALLTDPTKYRQVVRALQYCTLTRPEISFSVNQLCQNMHVPTSVHWFAAKRVLCYLKSLVNHSLFYQKGPFTSQPIVTMIRQGIQMIDASPLVLLSF